MTKWENKRHKLVYVDCLIALIMLLGVVWMYLDFDYFLRLDNMPSGKAAKLGVIIIYKLNQIGGKLFTISLIFILIAPFVYKSFKKLYLVLKGKKKNN